MSVVGRLVVLSDVHFGVHDTRAWDLTLQIIPKLNADKILILGDMVEFEPISRFQIPPDKRLLLQKEIDIIQEELGRLRNVFKGPIDSYLGNHELRVEKFLSSKAPELYGLKKLSLPELLDFKNFEIQPLRRDIPKREGKLLFIHGDEVKISSTHFAKNLYMKVNENVMCGHHHVESRYIHTMGGSLKQEGGWTLSCLRTLRPDWSPFSHWTQGFGIVEFSVGGFFHVEQVLYLKRGRGLWTKVSGVEYEI